MAIKAGYALRVHLPLHGFLTSFPDSKPYLVKMDLLIYRRKFYNFVADSINFFKFREKVIKITLNHILINRGCLLMRRRFGQRGGSRKFFFSIIALAILLIYSYYIVERNIKPTIVAMSEISARLIATQAINEAVNNKIGNNSFDHLVDYKTDNNGRISLIQANTVLMNKLAAETSMEIQKQIKEIGITYLKIPISSIFGSQIFANAGPKINVDIQPAGTVYVDFFTDFEAAGINQTRLKIYLIVKTDVQIIIPLASNKVDVTTHIPVSETIIVSGVPEWKIA
jgi:sporulation protein YunB